MWSLSKANTKAAEAAGPISLSLCCLLRLNANREADFSESGEIISPPSFDSFRFKHWCRNEPS